MGDLLFFDPSSGLGSRSRAGIQSLNVLGVWGLGVWDLGFQLYFRGLGVWGLGAQGLGSSVLGFRGLGP